MTTIAHPTTELLDRIVATVGELPTSPLVLSKAIELTSDLDSGVGRLSSVLSSDQVLAAKVLRLANSPFYGRTRQISSLSEAVLILGFHTIRSLVVASATHSLFRMEYKSARRNQLWEHSLACAMASRLLATYCQHAAVEELFMAGLLHDIGRLVLWQKLPDQYEVIIRTAIRRRCPFVGVELEQLGFSHADVGSSVLANWNFPPDICEAVAQQHNSRDRDIHSFQVTPASIIHFADTLVSSIGMGFYPDEPVTLDPVPPPYELALTAEDVEAITDELIEHYNTSRELFEVAA